MANVVTWPMPLTEKPSDIWSLTVEKTDVPVWRNRVREEISKPKGAGWTHMFNGKTDWCSFARFDFSGTVTVQITVNKAFKTASVVPRSAGIIAAVKGNTITFKMKRARHLTVLLDGTDDNALHLFAREPEKDVPNPKDSNVIYFGPGEHWVNTIKLKDNQVLYLDGGAILRATLPEGIKGKQSGVLNLFSYPDSVVNITSVKNVRVCGRGIIDSGALPHPARSSIRVHDATNVRIEGIMLRHSSNWHLPIAASEDVTVDNLVCLSGRLNSDGINCVSSNNVRVRNCFARTHDDTFVVKSMIPGRPCHDIVYENCVAWNDWGYALGMSYESRADIYDVTFRNCDVLFCRNWPIGIHVADGSTVSRILFENIEIDFPKSKINPQMGRAMIKIDNQKDVWAKDPGTGLVKSITLKNIDIKGSKLPPVCLNGVDADHPLEDIVFENVTINGSKLKATSKYFKVKKNVKGLVVK